MIKTSLADSRNGNPVKVFSEGQIGVTIHANPPDNERLETYPFRQYLTDDGSASGSNDMIVSSGEFYVMARQDVDIYINRLSWRIGDTGTVNLSRFGGLAALTTGCSLEYRSNKLGPQTLADELKTNLDMVRLGQATAPVGTGADAFLLDVITGGSEDTYLPVLDFKDTFNLHWGLRLRKGSNDSIVFTVNDNLTGLLTFNCIATGFELDTTDF